MRLILFADQGSEAERSYSLEEGRLLIGRGRVSDVTMSEPTVSSRHAVVSLEGDVFVLTDQQSRNGTFVNGRAVERVRLQTGDLIELGRGGPRLRVVIEERAAPATAEQPGPPVEAASLTTVSWSRSVGLRQSPRDLGLYDPYRDAGKTPRALGIGCAALTGAMLFVVLLAFALVGLGPAAALIAGILAFVPASIFLAAFLWLDRYDPEPIGPLAFAFGWGALLATFVSSLVNVLFGAAVTGLWGAGAGDTLTGVISAPLIEETTKGFGVLVIALLFRKDFDGVVDGIVYAGVVALGFAAVENVEYYGTSLLKEGAGGLAVTFVLRGIMGWFSHVLFTCMTGIGFGIARETHNRALRILMPLAGFGAAMVLHALWNTLASISAASFLLGYFLLELPLFFTFLAVFIVLVRREGRILRQILAAEVESGLITAQQLDTVISVFRRTGWVMAAVGDPSRLQARRHFLRAVSKLGLCYWHVSCAAAARAETGSLPRIPELRRAILRLRDQVG